MNQAAIFVSHSAKDSAFCDLLVVALQDAGFDAWAYEHDSVSPDAIPELVGIEFERRTNFIILLSPSALASQWVKREWDMALSSKVHELTLVTVAPLTAESFSGRWRLAEPMRRIEGPDLQPLPVWDAIGKTLERLGASPDTLLKHGKERIRNGDYQGAIPLLRVVTLTQPVNFSAWEHLAYAQIESQEAEEALVSSERALLLRPGSAGVWNTKAWALNSLRLHAAALVAAERAIQLEGGYAYIWNTYSEALLGLRRLDEALVASQRATTLDASWKWGWVQLATVLRELQRPEEAEHAERCAKEL